MFIQKRNCAENVPYRHEVGKTILFLKKLPSLKPDWAFWVKSDYVWDKWDEMIISLLTRVSHDYDQARGYIIWAENVDIL